MPNAVELMLVVCLRLLSPSSERHDGVSLRLGDGEAGTWMLFLLTFHSIATRIVVPSNDTKNACWYIIVPIIK